MGSCRNLLCFALPITRLCGGGVCGALFGGMRWGVCGALFGVLCALPPSSSLSAYAAAMRWCIFGLELSRGKRDERRDKRKESYHFWIPLRWGMRYIYIYIRFGYFIVCSAVAYAVYIYIYIHIYVYITFCKNPLRWGYAVHIYIYIGFRAQNQKTTGQPYMQVVTRVSAGAHMYVCMSILTYRHICMYVYICMYVCTVRPILIIGPLSFP